MTSKAKGMTVEYSAKEILEEIRKLDKKLDSFHEANSVQHGEIQKQTTFTNGKVKFLTKAMWTLGGIIFTVLFYLIQLHIG